MADVMKGQIVNWNGKDYRFEGGDRYDKTSWTELPPVQAQTLPTFGQSLQQEMASQFQPPSGPTIPVQGMPRKYDPNWLTKSALGAGGLFDRAAYGLKGLFTDLTPEEKQRVEAAKQFEGTKQGALASAGVQTAVTGPMFGAISNTTSGLSALPRAVANIGGSGALGAGIGALTSPGERLSGAIKQGTGAAAGAGLGELISGIFRPAAGSAAADYQASGVPLTPGQSSGGIVKSIEDANRIINPSVATRQAEGTAGWNKALLKDVVEAGAGPQAAKTVTASGHEGMQQAKDAFSAAYKAAGSKTISIDPAFTTAADDLVSNAGPSMTNKALDKLTAQIDVAKNMLNRPGAVKVEAVRQFEDDLSALARTASNKGQSALSRAYGDLKGLLEGLRARQGAITPQLDLAYAQFSRLKEAAASQGAMDTGVFSPGQLGNAIVQSSSKNQRAVGDALLQAEKAKAAQVFGTSIPPVGPGTAEKIILAGGLPSGVGYGMGTGNWWPLGIGAGLYGANKLAYTRPGAAMLTGGYPWQGTPTGVLPAAVGALSRNK